MTPSAPLTTNQSYTLTLRADSRRDDWSNGNTDELVAFVASSGTMYTGSAGVTTTQPIERSSVGNVVLFQAHLHDYDADLGHMRARVFDPRTGMFLQRDPMGFAERVNLYAGMRWNPTTLRDPTGLVANCWPWESAAECNEKVLAGLRAGSDSNDAQVQNLRDCDDQDR